MNKKGFTLVEIIVGVGLLLLIGVGSFIGIKVLNNNKRIERLNQITSKALEAAHIYLQTNKEAQTKLYEDNDGVVLSLEFLVNEGLLDIEHTGIKSDDIRNEYVLLADSPSFDESGNYEGCYEITEEVSWDKNKNRPIYLCTTTTINNYSNENEIEELKTIIFILRDEIEELKSTQQPTKSNREYLLITSNEDYYYRGNSSSNYIKFKDTDKVYRILSVDLYNNITIFGSKNDIVLPNYASSKILGSKVYTGGYNYSAKYYYSCSNGQLKPGTNNYTYNETVGINALNVLDLVNTCSCSRYWKRYYSGEQERLNISTWVSLPSTLSNNLSEQYPTYFNMSDYGVYVKENYEKVKLDHCITITDGYGTQSNPFVLENKCS